MDAQESDYVLREIHERVCGSHAGGQAVARKVLLAGYFWPTLKEDAKYLVQKCESCQRHQPGATQPVELIRSSVVACPFD